MNRILSEISQGVWMTSRVTVNDKQQVERLSICQQNVNKKIFAQKFQSFLLGRLPGNWKDAIEVKIVKPFRSVYQLVPTPTW